MLLRTFGGLSLDAETDGAPPSLGPRRLALLALVAAAGPHGITREKILGILWSETDEEQGRHALSQSIYSIRREVGAVWLSGTTRLHLDSIRSDVGEFEAALRSDQLERAAELYRGAFLDGFYLAGAPEFEVWVEQTRSRLEFSARKVIETLARRADQSAHNDEARKWWQRLSQIDPYSPVYAAGLINAHIVAGDHATARKHAAQYESRMRRELDAEPDESVMALTRQLPQAASPRSRVAAMTQLARAPRARRRLVPALLVLLVVIGAVAWQANRPAEPDSGALPFLAVGEITSRDTALTGPMLRDVLATNLARIRGLQVVANSRLVELATGQPNGSPALLTNAARRAGASEVLEGELSSTPHGLVLALRRVSLASGVMRQGYTVRARDIYALTDSMTTALAHDFGLEPPAGAVAANTRSAVAYALYEQGLRAYYEGDVASTTRMMNAALARDSTFAMAAAYAWRTYRAAGLWPQQIGLLPVVERLARNAVERERLWIQGMIAEAHGALPEFMDIARQLTQRYPSDPDGYILLGQALNSAGDFRQSVDAYNRAIAIDSAAGAATLAYCRICSAFYEITNSYMWMDSLQAAERTVYRLIAFKPEDSNVWGTLVEPLLRQGRRRDAEAAIVRAASKRLAAVDYSSLLDRDMIRSGRSDELEMRLVSELRTATPDTRSQKPWLLAFALRNQGRLREARALATNGTLPNGAGRLHGHSDPITLAVTAMESGEAREAARRFLDMVAADRAAQEGSGARARNVAWHMTLAATALAQVGDTSAIRALAQSVFEIGPQSSFGRDARLHNFLNGLLHQRAGRDREAVDAFRLALFSLTDGYTRINLELARSLSRLGRFDEAAAVLQPALRGGVDGGNTYVTHTELHEALADVFYAAGRRDSAAVHYAAVARAWRRADPLFAVRYRKAIDRSGKPTR